MQELTAQLEQLKARDADRGRSELVGADLGLMKEEPNGVLPSFVTSMPPLGSPTILAGAIPVSQPAQPVHSPPSFHRQTYLFCGSHTASLDSKRHSS